MANRRDETLAVLQQLGLTKDEAEEEISYREAEAERLLDEADEAERAEAAKQARAHLFATTPFYIVPRRRPAVAAAPVASRPTLPVSTEAARPSDFVPIKTLRPSAAPVAVSEAIAPASQLTPVVATAPESAKPADSTIAEVTEAMATPVVTAPVQTAAPAEKAMPAVTNTLRSMAIAVASSKRVITPPAHTNGNASAAPTKPDQALGLRLPRTPSPLAAQNGALRARVETPVVEPLPLEIPAPVAVAPVAAPVAEPVPAVAVEPVATDIAEIATPASPEVATLRPPITMNLNGSSSEPGAAAEAEAQPSIAHTNGVTEAPVATESPVAVLTDGHTAVVSAETPVLAEVPGVVEAVADATVVSPVGGATEPAVEAPAATDSADQSADEQISAPSDTLGESTTDLPLAAVVTAPEAVDTAVSPGTKPARRSRKKRRELAAADAALSAEKNPQPAAKSGGLLAPFKRYGRWTFRGPKWHFAAGLLAPVVVLALIVTAAFGQTQGWYSSSSPALASGAHITDPALSNKAYTSYVAAMNATLDAYGGSIDTINRIANQPLSSNPTWATDLNGAAVTIQDAGQNLRKIGVPLCVANSHHTLMVGVTNMDNAAENLIMGLRNSNPDNLTTSASLINSAKPLLLQSSTEIKATKC